MQMICTHGTHILMMIVYEICIIDHGCSQMVGIDADKRTEIHMKSQLLNSHNKSGDLM